MQSSNELSCKQVVELVTDYLERTLLAETEALFEEHLGDCSGCTTYVQQLRQTIDLLRKLAEEPVFPMTKEELVQLFQSQLPRLAGE
jgi:predicted anti-sigma-YlaC factor YlaD